MDTAADVVPPLARSLGGVEPDPDPEREPVLGVRIGLHTAEAARERRNYIGGGVHVAARVGASAATEEILVTSAVVDGAGPIRFGLSDPRRVALKGVREPIEVRAVEWRPV